MKNNNSVKNPLHSIGPQAKAHTLAAVYRVILSWPDPEGEECKPVAGNPDRNETPGGEPKCPQVRKEQNKSILMKNRIVYVKRRQYER